MPMTWVEPDIYLVRRGYTVYRTYKNDCADDVLTYWFSLCGAAGDNGDEGKDSEFGVFDVRDLPAEYREGNDLNADAGRKDAIRAAIDDDYFKDWNRDEPGTDVRRFEHDCAKCTFLGQFGDYDLYHCLKQGPEFPTVIARWGDDGPEYNSGMVQADCHTDPRLVEARKRAIARGLRVETTMTVAPVPMAVVSELCSKIRELEQLTSPGWRDRDADWAQAFAELKADPTYCDYVARAR